MAGPPPLTRSENSALPSAAWKPNLNVSLSQIRRPRGCARLDPGAARNMRFSGCPVSVARAMSAHRAHPAQRQRGGVGFCPTFETMPREYLASTWNPLTQPNVAKYRRKSPFIAGIDIGPRQLSVWPGRPQVGVELPRRTSPPYREREVRRPSSTLSSPGLLPRFRGERARGRGRPRPPRLRSASPARPNRVPQGTADV
jgi:hypothetical protein